MTMPKFRIAYSVGNSSSSANSEAQAIKTAATYINNTAYNRASEVGIYRLVKIVKRKDVPVEIEEVSACEDKPSKKHKGAVK